jgi:Uri superfamily endonuclease
MKGTYSIVLQCRRPMRVRFGKLGFAKVEVGYYLYTGSALGRGSVSLEGRLARHMRPSKKMRWHVDYLTSRPGCYFRGAVYLISKRHLECKINRSIQQNLNLEPSLLHIGASDCGCDGHLLRVTEHSSEAELINQLECIYSSFGVPKFIAALGLRSAVPPPIS